MDGWVLDVYLVWSSMEIICRKKQKELDFNRSAHAQGTCNWQDESSIINSTNLIMVTPGCTSKGQPLDVCINKPFKGVLSNC